MKHYLLLSTIVVGASAAHGQDAPAQQKSPIIIAYVETTNSAMIGGQTVQSQNLKFSDLKVLGSWMSKDKAGRHGYIFVDEAQKPQWENKELMASLGGKLLEVTRIQHWESGETALVVEDVDDEAAALFGQGNFHAPLSEQFDLQWQLIDNAKLRLTIAKRGAGNLRLAPDNANISFRLARNGQPLEPLLAKTTKRASQPANFESLTAGARWQRDFELSRTADFSQPGSYRVEVKYQLPVQNGGSSENSGVTTLNFTREFEIVVPRK